VVETQEKAATRDITDNASEQSRLEELLDEAKPPVPSDCKKLSYLLMTPFRYPPLRHGSRFGTPWERGIFYGASELETAFAESAVYFWLFQKGPKTLGPLEVIRDHRTSLFVRLSSRRTMKLDAPQFSEYHGRLANPASWEFTQQLGKQLRELEVEFIAYPSARWQQGNNVAVFSPSCFASLKPETMELWNVILTMTHCWFGTPDGRNYEFNKKHFEVDERIPHPSL
jgi:hypothetical protein